MFLNHITWWALGVWFQFLVWHQCTLHSSLLSIKHIFRHGNKPQNSHSRIYKHSIETSLLNVVLLSEHTQKADGTNRKPISQNHRMVGVGRDLCGSSSPNPPAEAGSPTAGCIGPCPGRSSISPEKETPQPPWTACSRAPSLSE